MGIFSLRHWHAPEARLTGVPRRAARMAGFAELGLSSWLVEQCRQLGLKQPTPVQLGCIPAILEGECDRPLPQEASPLLLPPPFPLSMLVPRGEGQPRASRGAWFRRLTWQRC